MEECQARAPPPVTFTEGNELSDISNVHNKIKNKTRPKFSTYQRMQIVKRQNTKSVENLKNCNW